MKRYSYNRVQDTSRRQKAQQAIKGTNKNVRTFAILTAENPNGVTLSPAENKQRNNELEHMLSFRKYLWFPIKGKYKTDEHSYIVYNLAVNDAEYISKSFEQQSFIFATVVDDGCIYDYYECEYFNKPYVLVETEDMFIEDIDDLNPEEMWSAISRDFKFRIPFFDHVQFIDKRLDLVRRVTDCDVDWKLDMAIKGGGSGFARHADRFMLWYKPLDE